MPSASDLLTQFLQASTQGQDALALALLQQAASQPDASAEVLFALGSEHVERGEEAEGLACFERALVLNPGLPIARFQLGFLHALSGRAAQAEAVWAGFDTQAPTHPQAGYLALLAQGLRAWQRGDMAQAAQGLRQGMAANFDNAPLNANMQKLLDRLQGVVGASSAAAVPPRPQAECVLPGHLGARHALVWMQLLAGDTAGARLGGWLGRLRPGVRWPSPLAANLGDGPAA